MYYKRIRKLREDNNKTQAEIAKLLNTSQQHYSRIKKGQTEISSDKVVTLAKYCNVAADYILELTN